MTDTGYSVSVSASAERDIRKLPHHIAPRIAAALRELAQEPRPHGHKRLRTTDYLRIRVGDYRIIYTIDEPDRQVTILAVGHRREVYR